MNPLDWYNFLREIANWDAERLAAFFTGVAVTLILGGLVLWILRRIFRRRRLEYYLQKIRELGLKNVELAEARSHLALAKTALEHELGTARTNLALVEQDVERLNENVQDLQADLETARGLARQADDDKHKLQHQNATLTSDYRSLKNERRRLQDQVEAERLSYEEKTRELTADLDQRADQIQELTGRLEELERVRRVAEEEKADLLDQLRAVNAQIKGVIEMEGKIWEKPPRGVPPPFRPLAGRAAPIIAVANLKGGVGKTTITANLGATLWNQGQRVLLVDLDYQGSLTSLCLSARQIHDLRKSGRMVQAVFQAYGGDVLEKCITRIGDTDGCVLAADEKLTDVEMHAMARWLLDPHTPDVRFLLRQALHAPAVQDAFDVILLDFPPRLTTAAINALAACDYVLVPVLLDLTSVEAVPRMLKWLRYLRTTTICPQLKILGILGNRAHPHGSELIARERDIWKELPAKCRDAWGDAVYHFRTVLRQKAQFPQAATDHTFAALTPELQPVFQDLASELKRRTTIHESRRIPGLSAEPVRSA